MEFLKNNIIKIILTIFLLSVGMDLVTRMFFTPPKLHSTQTSTQGNPTPVTPSSITNTSPYAVDPDSLTPEEKAKRASFRLQPIHISLCTSCGYSQKLDELKKHILASFPETTITVANYPLSLTRVVLSYAFRGLQFAIGAVMILGDKIFEYLQITPPPLYYRLLEKKMMVVMAVVMLGNMLCSQITATGAFEVFYGGRILHSKLVTGQFPQADYIVHQLFELMSK